MRSDHLVEGALIPDLHRLLYAPVLDDKETPLLRICAIGRPLPRFEDAIDERIGYGVGLEAPHCPRRAHDLKKLSAVDHEKTSVWDNCVPPGRWKLALPMSREQSSNGHAIRCPTSYAEDGQAPMQQEPTAGAGLARGRDLRTLQELLVMYGRTDGSGSAGQRDR